MSAHDAVDPADLIPDARRWNDGRGIDPEGWIACIGSYELAVGYSLIFWPRFVRFEGYVLRDGFSEAALRGFERSTGRDRTTIEGVMNHLHLADLHPNAAATEGQLRHLGRVLREIHAAKLARDFPDLRFEIRFDDEPGLDPLLYELSFWRTG